MRYALVFAALSVVCLLPAWALTAEPEQKLMPNDGSADDLFSYDVALDGNTALIGAVGDDDNGLDSGSAYVFNRAAGVWTEQAKLLAADGAAEDWFGRSVAVDGNTALVGAKLHDHVGTDSGSAYVFVRSGGSWTQQAELVADDGTPNDQFGLAVALHGDTAVIGSGRSAAYVFLRTDGYWSQQAKLLAMDGAAGDFFGFAVALAGDTAVIGAIDDDDNGTDSGSAYVFLRTDGNWSQQAKLLAMDGAAGDWFGWSVAVDGNTALIGAMSHSHVGNDSGSAYVFVRSGGSWTQQAELVADDADADDLFGYSVAVDGDNALVGAMNADLDQPGSYNWVGAAYLFARLGTVWSQQDKLVADDYPVVGDCFGAEVSMDADTLIVSAEGRDDNGNDSGAAYVFRIQEDADVPAVGGLGLLLLLLAVFGTGVYFMRRKVTC